MNNNNHDEVPSIYIDGLGVPEVYIAVEYGEAFAPRLAINPFTVTQKPVYKHRLSEFANTVRARPITKVRVIPVLLGKCYICGEGCESLGLPVRCGRCNVIMRQCIERNGYRELKEMKIIDKHKDMADANTIERHLRGEE